MVLSSNNQTIKHHTVMAIHQLQLNHQPNQPVLQEFSLNTVAFSDMNETSTFEAAILCAPSWQVGERTWQQPDQLPAEAVLQPDHEHSAPTHTEQLQKSSSTMQSKAHHNRIVGHWNLSSKAWSVSACCPGCYCAKALPQQLAELSAA
jgi:hypothetical protein